MTSAYNNKQRIEDIYHHMWSKSAEELLTRLDESLHPRPSAMLYDVAASLGINASSTVLDAGSGLGIYSCGLATRFGCRAFGIDISDANLEMARARAIREGLSEKVTFQQGNIQSLPFADATFDLIWCRDMLVHVRELGQTFAEFARVLKPNGNVLIHTTFATDALEPREAAYIVTSLDLVPANMQPDNFEALVTSASLSISSKESIGSEWLEYNEEQNERFSEELLYVTRLRRMKESIVAEFGQQAFDVTLSVYLWHIYLLLGKVSSTIYTLNKVSTQ